MKRRTKKIQAKLELIELADRDALLSERQRVAELITIIDDIDLSRVTAEFVLAKQAMERALDEIAKELIPFLPDDSDF